MKKSLTLNIAETLCRQLIKGPGLNPAKISSILTLVDVDLSILCKYFPNALILSNCRFTSGITCCEVTTNSGVKRLEAFNLILERSIDIVICTSVLKLNEIQFDRATAVVFVNPLNIHAELCVLQNFQFVGSIEVFSDQCFSVISQARKIDAVIPVGPNDQGNARSAAFSIAKYVTNIRNIYTIANTDLGAGIWVDEALFSDLWGAVVSAGIPNQRRGWYFQQLVKFSVDMKLKSLSDHFLIVDADTVFKRNITFLDTNDTVFFTTATEYHHPYFDHMGRVIPWLRKQSQYSGVAHHMLMSQQVLRDLRREMSVYNETEWFNAFLLAVDPQFYASSGASEYEIYFNYYQITKPGQCSFRELHWNDQYRPDRKFLTFDECEDFHSHHWYLR
jgi:hypothetical protein